MSHIIRCSKTRRLTLRVVSCGPVTTKALFKAFINLPTTAPARSRGEDSVGVNAAVCSKSSQRLATFRSNKIGLLLGRKR